MTYKGIMKGKLVERDSYGQHPGALSDPEGLAAGSPTNSLTAPKDQRFSGNFAAASGRMW
jgi:hypothetical protein